MPTKSIVLALGRIAHGAVLRACNLKANEYPFGHGRVHRLGNQSMLVDSYHCSRYNTQTGRLTKTMFNAVFDRIAQLLQA